MAVTSAPSATITSASLSEIGDALHRQLDSLASDPTPSRCAEIAINLGGAALAVMRLRAELTRDSTEVAHGDYGRVY